jgi:hypothetical protein
MEPQQKRQHQQGWGSTTSNRQVCHCRLSAHKQYHRHATATPVADTTKQTSIYPDSDDVPHSIQPRWYTSGTPPQPHLSSNQRPFTTIPGTTHKNYSVQDIILLTSHTPLEPTTRKCGGIRHPRQIQGSAVYGNSHLNLHVFNLLTCTVHKRHPHPKLREYFIGYALYPEEEEEWGYCTG